MGSGDQGSPRGSFDWIKKSGLIGSLSIGDLNPKHEIRNSKQIRMPERAGFKTLGLNIGILSLDIVSDFDIRISKFIRLTVGIQNAQYARLGVMGTQSSERGQDG